MHYREQPASGNSYTHQWDVSTVRVYDGGFLLDKSNLPAGLKVLPRGTFMAVDLEERIASIVKTVELHEAITAASTVAKVKKGSLLVKNDIIGINGKFVTIGNIDTSDSEFDVFNIVANSLGTAEIGDVLQSYKVDKAMSVDGLNYGDENIDDETTISVIYEVDKVKAEKLPYPITDEIITSLKHCQILKK